MIQNINTSSEANVHYTPERRLIASVLARAVLDLVGNEQQDRVTATIWLREGNSGPISFHKACEILDIDSDDFLISLEGRGFFNGARCNNLRRNIRNHLTIRSNGKIRAKLLKEKPPEKALGV